MDPRIVAALTASLALACGSAEEPDSTAADSPTDAPTPGAPGAGPAGATAQAPPEPARPIDPNETGTVRGTVRFAGEAPEIRVLTDVPEQPGCHEGHDEPPISEYFLVRDGAVQNAVVHVDSGLEGWRVPDAEPDEHVLEQRGCIYRPHVLGMRAGDTLRVENLDPTNHNVNARAVRNESFNRNQGPGSPAIEVVLDEEEIVPLRCDIHPWMSAHVAVFEHPFFAVTGEDGSFVLDGLPPGEFELEAVHPDNKKIGRRGKVSRSVTVKAGETTEVTLTFE